MVKAENAILVLVHGSFGGRVDSGSILHLDVSTGIAGWDELAGWKGLSLLLLPTREKEPKLQAVNKMTLLVLSENRMSETIKFLLRIATKLQILNREAKKDRKKFVQHPVNAFKLIRMLFNDIGRIEQYSVFKQWKNPLSGKNNIIILCQIT